MKLPHATDISLRPAMSEDKEALVRLLHRTWRSPFAPHLPAAATTNYVDAALAENYIRDQWRELLVAIHQEEIVGFSHAENNLIAALHVDPTHWGKGIGQHLIAAIEQQILDRGYRISQLQVEGFNERAIRLYEQLGYIEISRQPDQEFNPGGMSILMAKPFIQSPCLIRTYQSTDRPRCFALFDSNVPDYFAPEEKTDFAELLDELDGPYLVIEDAAGNIVACGGFAVYQHNVSRAVLCWGMVRRDLHGKRLGKQLLTARLDLIAVNPDIRTVAIETTQQSRGFFEHFGFVVNRIEPDGFAPGFDLVDMTLELERS